jgi:hypothetical protein
MYVHSMKNFYHKALKCGQISSSLTLLFHWLQI